jgi:UDP-galactopyranose mutase
MYDYLIVGTGFAGAVMAERLASKMDKKILLVEKRSHIGGNAYDEYDENGILVHRYGPHIFHTNSREVFEYLSQFTEWRFYEHKVLANIHGELYPIPINRLTLNKLYGLDLKTESEVQAYYDKIKVRKDKILNSEDQIVSQVGYDLFEKFFRHYTKKQWGMEARELDPSVCGRIPVRTNDDCRYFTDKYQFMPKDGYTKMFERMLAHKNIEIVLNTDYKDIVNNVKFNKMVYTGPVDYYFDYEFGKLPYRSIEILFENVKMQKVQSAAVINENDKHVLHTRSTEYKYLTSQNCDKTTISKEFPVKDNEPFYPIFTDKNINLYKKYFSKCLLLNAVNFVGRLSEYKYYNMDKIVETCIIKTKN